MAAYGGIQKEETLKAQVFQDYFGAAKFLYRPNIDNIDFVVMDKTGRHVLWGESKKSESGVHEMFVQLILTIGKARAFDKNMPPQFLAAFDNVKFAFIPYSAVYEIFFQNDFNWNVAPSNYDTKEFIQIKNIVESAISRKKLVFSYDGEGALLKEFIHGNLYKAHELFPDLIVKTQIDKTNFPHVYRQWAEGVKPSINIDWELAKKRDLLDGDFYLADLISEDNRTIKDNLYVLLEKDSYRLDRKIDDLGLFSSKTVEFKDSGAAHKEFWDRYKRPPREEYWDYIVERRDLLVPQDVRERKGAFFTPPQWVAKAHEYLSKTFGGNWQEEYYVWDNSAGSGNLLAGLINRDNIWASTLDKQDVGVMYDRIENGANLWKEQVFQFDFLNDDFIPVSKGGKLPDKLYEIISDSEKRKKLIFLINPPYGEAANARTRTSGKVTSKKMENKPGVKESKMNKRFHEIIGGMALNEKYIQFFARIYADVPGSKMAAFVKPKYISGPNMKKFRDFWKAKYLGGFATPAVTHDNCTGKYPICLFMWDLNVKENFPEKVLCDIFNEKEEYGGVKTFYSYDGCRYIIEWLRNYYDKEGEKIAYLRMLGTDMQNSQGVYIIGQLSANDIKEQKYTIITKNNLIEMSIYFATRKVIPADWLNDRDQFLYPNDGWENDNEFKNDCLVYTLFDSYNKIKSREMTNHWIPFTEAEVGCEKRFESRFMSDFIAGKLKTEENDEAALLDGMTNAKPAPLEFSREASAVFDAGRGLWKYYHGQPKAIVNASFYEIREHFQGRNDKGNMNTKSQDMKYNELIGILRGR
ncbi:MAG: hypothetical protein LBU82_00985, partial [Treponema sp.]|nr:hypothetical protein [Treponema sp.]